MVIIVICSRFALRSKIPQNNEEFCQQSKFERCKAQSHFLHPPYISMGLIWVVNMNKVIRLILPSSKNCHLWINFVTLNKKCGLLSVYIL